MFWQIAVAGIRLLTSAVCAMTHHVAECRCLRREYPAAAVWCPAFEPGFEASLQRCSSHGLEEQWSEAVENAAVEKCETQLRRPASRSVSDALTLQ